MALIRGWSILAMSCCLAVAALTVWQASRAYGDADEMLGRAEALVEQAASDLERSRAILELSRSICGDRAPVRPQM